MKVILIAVCVVFHAFLLQAANVVNLRCEYLTDPYGVDVPSPRLSWAIESPVRADVQQAYQILVSSSRELLAMEKGDVWNTGRIESDQSVHVQYVGTPLQSTRCYYWKVRIWDGNGKSSAWSGPAFWTMGLLTPQDWQHAKWIAFKDGDTWKKEWKQHKEDELNHVSPQSWPNSSWPWLTGKDSTIFTLYEMAHPAYDPSPLFRKEFTISKKVRAASLYVCGLGYYEAFLNGSKIGNHVLDPGWTNFEKRSLYVTYDITNQLVKGDNAIGFMLGRGQYNPLCNDIWGLSKSAWVDQPKVIALVIIEYADGTKTSIVTDNSWKTCGGPVVYEDTRHGELYDARLEQAGWTTPHFSEGKWNKAAEVEWNAPLVSQMIPPVRCFDPIVPVKSVTAGPGITVYDIGKNIAGWARVTVHGKAGARVLVEYCETPSDSILLPNLPPSRFHYTIRDKNYAAFYDKCVNVRQQNGYILRGGESETFECHFSYKGYQFIRVTAENGVAVDQVFGIPVHTDVESAGGFSCSDPVVNQTQQNAVTSMLNNYHSIATDCPHREKQGWTADNYMSAEAAMFNFNMASFYTKWLTDLAGTQSREGGLGTVAPATNYDMNASTVWPAAIVFIPWDMYGFYGDTRPMEENYATMCRFANSSLQRQVQGKPEIINDVLGDWLAPLMTISDTGRNNTMAPPEGFTLYGTSSHYLIVKRLSDISRVLDHPEEQQQMQLWSERIAGNFNREFFDKGTGIYHGDKPTGYRQSANIVPLEYGLVPADRQVTVLKNLEEDIHRQGNRLSTGFLGTWAMMDYLPARNPELAYTLATQTSYPGWGYMIKQGANSMWESWDGYDSHNHTPFCLISAYFYKYLAGIQPDYAAPGFRQFTISPSVVGDLTFVNAYHDSMYGRIGSSWKKENGELMLTVSVPVGCIATVFVPSRPGSVVMESGMPANRAPHVEFLHEENNKSVYRVSSGTYQFISKI
jgi:alpha-L-rhamnosidase